MNKVAMVFCNLDSCFKSRYNHQINFEESYLNSATKTPEKSGKDLFLMFIIHYRAAASKLPLAHA